LQPSQQYSGHYCVARTKKHRRERSTAMRFLASARSIKSGLLSIGLFAAVATKKIPAGHLCWLEL
jgi:hypothetical protein